MWFPFLNSQQPSAIRVMPKYNLTIADQRTHLLHLLADELLILCGQRHQW
jgi:hypothetical protein